MGHHHQDTMVKGDRIQYDQDGTFDELVIYYPKSLHIERMNEAYIWLRVIDSESKAHVVRFEVGAEEFCNATYEKD